MQEINFQPVFDYIDQNSVVLKEEILSAVDLRLVEIRTDIANLSGQMKDFREEMLISSHRTDRLEAWAKRVGKKVDIPIEF